MRILNVAYPFAPVHEDAVGGAEEVLFRIDRELTRLGHESRVVACEGSAVAGRLVATPSPRRLLGGGRRDYRFHRRAIESLLSRHEIDLIHFHGIDCHEYLPLEGSGVPMLVTLHLPPSWYPAELFSHPRLRLHCVSRAQERQVPAGARLLPVIENGVDVAPPPRCKRRFALAMGRICPEKGFHLALEAAREACLPLALAGRVFPHREHEAYFEREISPRLDRRRRFLGPVGGRRKRRLLASAQCLLIPSLAPETSSLVAMEALAAGTPVIAFPAGALAELVEPGRTGFLVRDAGEMAAAIPAAAAIDPRVCQAAARERFPLERTLRRYLETYQTLITHG